MITQFYLSCFFYLRHGLLTLFLIPLLAGCSNSPDLLGYPVNTPKQYPENRFLYIGDTHRNMYEQAKDFAQDPNNHVLDIPEFIDIPDIVELEHIYKFNPWHEYAIEPKDPVTFVLQGVRVPEFLYKGTRDIAVVIDLNLSPDTGVKPLVAFYQREVPSGVTLNFQNLIVYSAQEWSASDTAYVRVRLIDVSTERNKSTETLLLAVGDLASKIGGMMPHPIMPVVTEAMSLATVLLSNRGNQMLLDYQFNLFSAAAQQTSGGSDLGVLKRGRWIVMGRRANTDPEIWASHFSFNQATGQVLYRSNQWSQRYKQLQNHQRLEELQLEQLQKQQVEQLNEQHGKQRQLLSLQHEELLMRLGRKHQEQLAEIGEQISSLDQPTPASQDQAVQINDNDLEESDRPGDPDVIPSAHDALRLTQEQERANLIDSFRLDTTYLEQNHQDSLDKLIREQWQAILVTQDIHRQEMQDLYSGQATIEYATPYVRVAVLETYLQTPRLILDRSQDLIQLLTQPEGQQDIDQIAAAVKSIGFGAEFYLIESRLRSGKSFSDVMVFINWCLKYLDQDDVLVPTPIQQRALYIFNVLTDTNVATGDDFATRWNDFTGGNTDLPSILDIKESNNSIGFILTHKNADADNGGSKDSDSNNDNKDESQQGGDEHSMIPSAGSRQ